MQPARKSHSGIPGSKAACAYPGLIAACHALRRPTSRAIHQLASLRFLLGHFTTMHGSNRECHLGWHRSALHLVSELTRLHLKGYVHPLALGRALARR